MFLNWVQDLLRASATTVDSVYHHFLFPLLEKQDIIDVALKQNIFGFQKVQENVCACFTWLAELFLFFFSFFIYIIYYLCIYILY